MSLAERPSPLSIEHLSKSIGGREIVSDLSFTLEAGEVFGFLGPNGAGKTTTIRMLVGLIYPTRGRVTIMGHDVQTERTAAMRYVGAIVENPELYKFLTGRQNLEQAVRLIGTTIDADGTRSGVSPERVEEVIELVGLKDRINDKVGKYSLGMRQRLGIAQALLNRPALLILDEPTNGLDPSGIRELRELMRRLARDEQVSVFVSSHLLSEIEMMCDRVAIIDEGHIVGVERLANIATKVSEESELRLGIGKDRSSDEVTSIVETCSVVHSVRKLSQEADVVEGESQTVLLSVEVNSNDMPNLIRHLVKAEVDIYEITQLKQTLEDHFLSMTGGATHG